MVGQGFSLAVLLYSRLVADLPKDIPKRAAYKAAEVCDIAHIQPYVLRTWESEFPKMGVVRGGARIYRYSDLEQVLRIKQLVFDEGLTLAGARRRIEEDSQPQPDLPLEQFVTPELKEGIGRVRSGLRDLLGMLGGQAIGPDATKAVGAGGDGRGTVPAASARRAKRMPPKTGATSRAKTKAGRAPRRHIGRA